MDYCWCCRKKPKLKSAESSVPGSTTHHRPYESGYSSVDVEQTDNGQSLLMVQPQRVVSPSRNTHEASAKRPELYAQINKLREPSNRPTDGRRGRRSNQVHMTDNDLYGTSSGACWVCIII